MKRKRKSLDKVKGGIMKHTWDQYFDTTSECWTKLQDLYAANEHFPKEVVKGRNLHHKFLRSWSRKEKEAQDDDDDNLVSLSEGDHFLAHFYIWKSAKKGYRASAALAVRMMYRKSLKYITAEIAEDIAKVWEHKEYTPTEETRRKISNAHKGKPKSDEMKRKISETEKGKNLSDKTKLKMSEAHKECKHSEETKRKISNARKGRTSNFKGKHLSEEAKQKMSNAKKGLSWRIDSQTGKRVWYRKDVELNS